MQSALGFFFFFGFHWVVLVLVILFPLTLRIHETTELQLTSVHLDLIDQYQYDPLSVEIWLTQLLITTATVGMSNDHEPFR